MMFELSDPLLAKVWAVGYAMQIENKTLKEAVARLFDKLTDEQKKLEAIQNWLLDERFQSVRDNVPDYADYPRFGDFYSVYSNWVGEFWEWLERCPICSVAILGEKKDVKQ